MIRLENITADADQVHKLEFINDTVTIRLRFYEAMQFWTMCVGYNGIEVKGIRCAVGVRLVPSNNFPFDIYINDDSQNGQDPFRLEDFAERMSVYILEPEEIESIRGYDVQV